jgi:hypothetical protein
MIVLGLMAGAGVALGWAVSRCTLGRAVAIGKRSVGEATQADRSQAVR